MTQGPISNLCWLISRASAVVAVVVVSLAALLGLAMAAKALRDPGRRRAAVKLHEDLALLGLLAVAVHGGTLLGDTWLRPGLAGITVPFLLPYRPAFTGAGVIAGYLMLLLGPSFYLRRRLGAKRWRSLHRATILIWPLAAVHTLGAGSDAHQLWLRVIVLLPAPALAYLLVARLAHRRAPARARTRPAADPDVPVLAEARAERARARAQQGSARPVAGQQPQGAASGAAGG